jgi:hypothetical protein
VPAQARLFGSRHWRGKRWPMGHGRSAAALCALANSRTGLKRACFGIDLTGDSTMLNHELRHDETNGEGGTCRSLLRISKIMTKTCL